MAYTNTYTTVTWTSGDTITETKMDNMVSNDSAYDSHTSSGFQLDNNIAYSQEDSGSTRREVMKLDSSDVLQVGDGSNMEVGLNTMASASAYLSADQTNLTSGSWVKVNLNTEAYDNGSDFDTGNYKFVTPVAGRYLIVGHVLWKSVVANKVYRTGIYIDSTLARANIESVGDSTSDIHTPCVLIADIAATIDIELYARQDSGVNTVDIGSGSDQTSLDVQLLSV